MTRKQRHAIYELIAITVSGFGLAFSIPALVSAHDSVALLAALLLAVAWMGWIAYFVYRIHHQEKL